MSAVGAALIICVLKEGMHVRGGWCGIPKMNYQRHFKGFVNLI